MSLKKVLVVGGGSAGWITATYMNAAMNPNGIKNVEISLVESPDTPKIGVGEATIPTIRQVIQTLGLNEIEFMKRTEATFKQGIKFVDWLDYGEDYYHQFSRYNPEAIDMHGATWLKSDGRIPFADTVSAQPRICELELSPKLIGPRPLQTPLNYAYHLNALKFSEYLCEIGVENGVTHYLDDVVDLEMKENGHIKSAKTKSGKTLEADLFIDCTGFSGHLINKKLGVKWESFSQYLMCDRSVVMQIPYDTYYPGKVRSSTISTAKSSGWIWDIPLVSRRGVGYVYSSQFISDEAAEQELRNYEGIHSEGLDTRIVPFNVGMRKESWVGNCVAIGLSSGFVEPLESTGLYFAQLATLTLAEYFPYDDDFEPLAKRFNKIVSDRFVETMEFLTLHYCLTKRTDSDFWKEVVKSERIPDSVKAKIEFWKFKPPSRGDFPDNFTLFSYQNHELILYGMDFMRDHFDKKYGPNRPPLGPPSYINNRFESLKRQLPTHEAWLQRSVGMKEFGSKKNHASIWDKVD